jgi:hypothetical protein
MQEKFYAARLEGDFDSVAAALRRVGFDDEAVEHYLANAAIDLSQAVHAPVDDETSAVVIEREGRFLLWRGFTGPSFICDSDSEALNATLRVDLRQS